MTTCVICAGTSFCYVDFLAGNGNISQPVTGDYAKSVFAYVISTLQYLLQYSNPKCKDNSKKKESDESQYSFIVNN